MVTNIHANTVMLRLTRLRWISMKTNANNKWTMLCSNEENNSRNGSWHGLHCEKGQKWVSKNEFLFFHLPHASQVSLYQRSIRMYNYFHRLIFLLHQLHLIGSLKTDVLYFQNGRLIAVYIYVYVKHPRKIKILEFWSKKGSTWPIWPRWTQIWP